MKGTLVQLHWWYDLMLFALFSLLVGIGSDLRRIVKLLEAKDPK